MADENSRKLTKYRIAIFALFVVIAMVGGAVLASPATAESDSTEHVLSGTVIDESDDPIEDAVVFIQDDETDELVAEVPTDADGEYEIELEEGNYLMAAEADGFLSPSPVTVTLDEDRTQNLELENAATLEGEVTDTEENTLEDVEVKISQDGEEVTRTRTSHEGKYSVELAEGEYTVEISERLYEDTSTVIDLTDTDSETEDFKLTSLTTGTLEGTVTDEEDNGIEDASIIIRQDGDFVEFVRADEEGAYKIELEEGDYDLSADADGYLDDRQSINIAEDETTNGDFELEIAATVEGTVTDEDDTKIEDVRVSVEQDGSSYRASTDEEGMYSIDVPEGDYTVTVSDFRFESDSVDVFLEKGETKEEDLEVTPASTGTLEGEVTDGDGESLEEAFVDIQQDGVHLDFATTDADGQYDIELAEGEYTVFAIKDGFQFEHRTVDIDEDATTIEDFELAELVTLDGEVTDTDDNALAEVEISLVQDGETVGKTQTDSDGEYEVEVPTGEYTVEISDSIHEDISEEVTLDESETENFELEPLSTGTLEGEVTEEESDPISDAELFIVQDGDLIERALSDENGNYEVELTDGEYEVFAVADGFVDESEEVEISTGETREQNFALQEAVTLDGEVTDTQGNALAEVDLRLVQDGETVEETQTDSDGEYEVEVPTGEYTVKISDSIHEDINEVVTLDESKTENFELEPLSTGTLEGEVTDEEGEPIEDGHISIRQDGDFVESVWADEEGAYKTELEEGDYDLSVRADGFVTERQSISISEDDTTTKGIELETAAEVEGTVTDEGGNEVEDIFVGVKQDGVLLTITPTGEDGSYSQEVAEGDYTVSVIDPIYEGDNEEVSLTAGETTTQDLEATPASTGTLEGEVTDEDETSIEEARVTIYQDGVFIDSIETTENGEYELELGEGEYSALVDAGDSGAVTTSISVEADETTTKDFVAQETGTIEGTVLDEDDTEISDSTVNIKQDGELLLTFLTRDDGSYEGHLPPGEYTLTGDANGYEEESHTVTVTEDKTVTQEFELELLTTTVEGEVLDEDENAVEDVDITITQDDEEVESVSTGEDGSYETELVLGQYTVSVDEDGYESQDSEVTLVEGEISIQDFTLVVEEDDESDTGGGGAPSLGPADFEVTIRDAPDSVVAGETVSVEVAVNNVGGTTGEQTITLSMDGEQIGDESLELSRDQQRFITLTGEVDESAAGEHTFTISSDDDSVETALTIEGDTEEETDETDETDDSETEETDEDDADEADTDETEGDSEAASDDSTETDETDDEPAEDEIVEDDDQPGFGVTVAVIALLGLLAGTRLSSRKE